VWILDRGTGIVHIIITEGYTDCALIEAVIEKGLNYKRYTNIHNMPELFQRTISPMPSPAGDIDKFDLPHFFHAEDNSVVVKVAGGVGKICSIVENYLQIYKTCDENEKIDSFIVFTDADLNSHAGIVNKFKAQYKDENIEFDGNKKIVFEGNSFIHNLFIIPQKGYGAVEKILLEISKCLYPDLYNLTSNVRDKIMQPDFKTLRDDKWVKTPEIQELYADKFQMGIVATAVKPDRPIGYAVRDEIITKDVIGNILEIPELKNLYVFLDNCLKH